MIKAEMERELTRLESAMGKVYSVGFKQVAFDYLCARSILDLRLSIDRVVATEKHLPTLSLILQNLPDLPAKDPLELSPHYWTNLRAKHDEAERLLGASFESFLRSCNRDHGLAALYFGQASWRKKIEFRDESDFPVARILRFDRFYEEQIKKRELL